MSTVRDQPDDDDAWLTARRRHIGDRIREERLRRNLTQERLHLAAGINRYTLQRAEAGQEIQVSTLLRIARVLDMTLSDLVR